MVLRYCIPVCAFLFCSCTSSGFYTLQSNIAPNQSGLKQRYVEGDSFAFSV